MTHVEKIIRGIEVCMDYISDCNQCPYNETDGMECLEALRDDVIALAKAREPRVLSAAEFAAMESGIGWLENCHTWDDICIERFAWVCGDTICEAGYSTKETLLDMYNLPDGVRVWVGHTQPSEDQRKAVAWDG